VWISAQQHQYTLGHHWALMHSTVDTLPAGFQLDTPVDCYSTGIAAYTAASLFVEQEAQSSYAFPDGAALPLKANGLLVLQIHGLNATPAQATGKLDVTLTTTTADQVVHRLGLIQFYDPFIYVPPMSSSSAHERCQIPSDITLVAAETHFHVRGVDEQIFVDLAGQPAASSPIVESTDWAHPNQWKGTLAVPAGSSIHYRCNYQNGDPRPYYQGQDKFGNEMCMTIGFYYPAIEGGFEGCFAPGQNSELGTGDKSCADTTTCLQSCPPGEAPVPRGGVGVDVGPCFQQCMASSCPSASTPLMAMTGCIQSACATACGSGGSACNSCVAQNCLSQYLACQNHTCN
jgi:hypothetical protein